MFWDFSQPTEMCVPGGCHVLLRHRMPHTSCLSPCGIINGISGLRITMIGHSVNQTSRVSPWQSFTRHSALLPSVASLRLRTPLRLSTFDGLVWINELRHWPEPQKNKGSARLHVSGMAAPLAWPSVYLPHLPDIGPGGARTLGDWVCMNGHR
jgi:hypothetical protein